MQKKYKNQIDLFVWGSPCQDLSLAGKRKGFDGDKSSLFREGARVQAEMMPKLFIFENVQGLLSSNKGNDYKEVCETFRKQGYSLVLLKMNTKDYGIPQNRPRIFIVGFLDVDMYHKFKIPGPTKLELRLKNLLQDWIPKKYFLSQKMIDGFIAHKKRHIEKNNGFKFNPTNGNKIASCLNCKTGTRPTDDYIELNQIGNIDKKGHNSLWGRVYSPYGISATLNANGGGAGAKTGLYQIKSNTKVGYELAKDYDCISLSQPKSKTRRGRVGKGYSQTLTTQSDMGVIYSFMIRRLTPYECFRLQGVKDEDITLVNSDTQSYKIAGNAISVNIMQVILESLYKRQQLEKVSLFDFVGGVE